MTPKCYQTLENGQRCSALAIHGSKYCRHHDLQHSPRPAKEQPRESEPLTLPLIMDKPSALAALNVVLQALGECRIKRSVGETLLSGIKFAGRLLTEIEEAGQTVRPAALVKPRTVALAASHGHADRARGPEPFNPARLYGSSNSFNDDPATARLVKELLAQSQQIARTQHDQKANS